LARQPHECASGTALCGAEFRRRRGLTRGPAGRARRIRAAFGAL